jgi:alpha,alpha-trehalase
MVTTSLLRSSTFKDDAMGKPIRELPSALDAIQEFTRGAKGKRLAVFLDYDGTLTPIVDRPEFAFMSDEMRAAVNALADHSTVAIISGRDRRDVEQLVQLDSLFFAGSHGFDIAGPHGWHVQHEPGTQYLPLIDRAEKALREALGGVKGAIIERKKYSVAVHYRLVADDGVKTVQEAVKTVLSHQPDLRMLQGKKVYDLQPRIDWDKGKAVLWLLQALDLNKTAVLPLYVGDDITDEDAFRALKNFGVGIVVGDDSRRTIAHYALKDPNEVQNFLQRLIASLRSTSL